MGRVLLELEPDGVASLERALGLEVDDGDNQDKLAVGSGHVDMLGRAHELGHLDGTLERALLALVGTLILIFVTLPNIFNHMAGGRLWGSLFFVFMAFAAFSTVLAVFENIMSCCMDLTGWSRKKTAAINIVLMILLSLPCVLGFNVWSGFQPFGPGSNVLDLEDFLVSTWLNGEEMVDITDAKIGAAQGRIALQIHDGGGIKVRDGIRFYVSYILPLIVLVIFVLGIRDKFFA